MRRSIQIAFSAVAILVILLGARHAYSRERFRHADLHGWYQQINTDHFEGKLKDVSVSWSTLPDRKAGVTDFSDNDQPVSIELDSREIATESEARQVLKHQMCHVKVGLSGHGSAWQVCMNSF